MGKLEIKNKRVLPLWGPYSKKYMGISKVVQSAKEKGVRFDVVVHPTLINSAVPVPNVTVPSSYHVWDAKEDLSLYTYRYELEWKDQVYADVSFLQLDEEHSLIRTEFVNDSDIPQSCILNYFNAIEYPFKTYCDLQLPKECYYLKANDYKEYIYAIPRPWDHLNPDATFKGEFFDERFTRHRGLGDRILKSHVSHLDLKPFGEEAGDRVSYSLQLSSLFQDALLGVRYQTVDPVENATFQFDFMKKEDSNFDCMKKGEVNFENTHDLNIQYIPIGSLEEGDYELTLESKGLGGIEFDFFVILESKDRDKVILEQKSQEFIPKVKNMDSRLEYSYGNVEETFYFQTFNKNIRYREIDTGCLEDCLITRLSNSDHTFDDVRRPFSLSFREKKSDPGYYHNPIVHSVFIPANETHIEYAVVGSTASYYSKAELEQIWEDKVKEKGLYTLSEHGKSYELSKKILNATLLTNIVYPIYRHGDYILHHTPGKRWDSLYTWDSGFIGLGLLESDSKLSEYILQTYLSEEDNKDFAFVHHGSMVPVQMFLFLEMLKRSNEKQKLFHYYDQLKRYYDFYTGKSEGSTTSRFQSNLLTSFDYFYNCSGMDDLPPQVNMHARKLNGVTSPVITTAHAIRCAKILSMVALKLGRSEDYKEYQSDISRFTDGLQEHSWDEECGYFSYVIHDTSGKPIEKLSNSDGENLNKTLDGVYPLIAGVYTKKQKEALLGHLKSDKEMFSKVGISAVDMSASYYSNNGYWNGSVWFAHQWFVWKTMLDLGEGEFAYKIAKTALDVFKRSTDYTYYTYEMFHIETEKGGWFHHFGGLTAPIIIWANAYYKVGTVTSGFNMWIEKYEFDMEFNQCIIEFEHFNHQDENSILIVVMNSKTKKQYLVECEGQTLNFIERMPGILEITIPVNTKKGTIFIK